jgi:hypothetical protein
MGLVVSFTLRPYFTPGEMTPGTCWLGDWVGFRAGLHTEANGRILCLRRGSNPDLPVWSQTLYWLSNPSSLICILVPLNNISFWNVTSWSVKYLHVYLRWSFVRRKNKGTWIQNYVLDFSLIMWHSALLELIVWCFVWRQVINISMSKSFLYV